MKKVVFNTWSGAFFKPGGGEVQLTSSQSALEKLGYRIELFDLWNPQRDADILHQFSTENGVEYVINAYKDLGKKIVVSPILWHNFTKDHPAYWRIKSVLESADMLFTNSNGESQLLHTQFDIPLDRFHKTRNSITDEYLTVGNPAIFRKTYKVEGDFVLSVANIDRRKNTEMLVKACKELKLPLVTIGHVRDIPYYESFKGCYSNWMHLGPIGDVTLLKSAYRACRVFALPSLCETPGLAAIEAASQGASIAITSEGPTFEYFGDGVAYVDPLDLTSIKKGISQAIDIAPEQNELLMGKVTKAYQWSLTAEDISLGYQKMFNC